KILLTTTGLSSIGQTGGISAYVHELATNLSERNYDVYVFLFKEDRVDKVNKKIKYKFRHFAIGPTFEAERQLVVELLKEIEKLSPDVIINNDTSYIAGLWPVIASDVVKISVMHGFSKKLSKTNVGITGKMACVNHQFIDYIVCQNTTMCSDVSNKYNVPLKKNVFIPQATSGGAIPSEKPVDFTIIFGSGKRKEKGALIMKKVCTKLKESSYSFRVKWCLDAGGIQNEFSDDNRFIFLGNLHRDRFLKELSESHCIIIPTMLDTGPMLLVEAMAEGVVPICNRLRESAIPDLIQDGFNGILIDDNDADSYFDVINSLMNNINLTVELAKNTFDFFTNRLNKDRQIERFEVLFRKKQARKKSKSFSNENIIYFHHKKTSHLSKFSLKRMF